MKNYNRRDKVWVDTQAKKNLDRTTRSVAHSDSKIKIREDEDCVFGSLAFFFSDDPSSVRRSKIFFKF